MFKGLALWLLGVPIWLINGVALFAYVLAILRTVQGFFAGVYNPDHATVE